LEAIVTCYVKVLYIEFIGGLKETTQNFETFNSLPQIQNADHRPKETDGHITNLGGLIIYHKNVKYYNCIKAKLIL